MTPDIRTLNLDQIETLIDWAAAEGWNPGRDDARRFQLADPNGFLGAFVDGRMVAGISVVAYSDHFGFLGLYICHPDFRGQGYGRAVWNAGMAYLGDRTIGLDGVPEQQANYRKMGFATQYETMRMGGVPRRAAPRNCELVPLTDGAVVQLLDRDSFPAVRTEFLDAWIASPHQSWVAYRNDQAVGFMVLRPCRDAQKVGPLCAHDAGIAADLLAAVDGAVQIDVPAHQMAWLRHLESGGFKPEFGTARMYRGPAPDIRMDRVFGVTTLELG